MDGSFADCGFVDPISGRPKEYQAKEPGDILNRTAENRGQEFEQFRQDTEDVREEFFAEFRLRYEQASADVTSTEELFHVVNVGDPSERETLRLYHEAKRHVCVITNSFEYFESVESAFADAHDRVGVDALYLHPDLLSEHKRTKQADVVEYVTTEYPDLEVRFSTDRLSWLGTLIESSIDYNSAEAIFLREESNVSNHIHQAAIT